MGPLPVASLIQVRGDWEFLSLAFTFPTAGQNSFCWLCGAATTPGAALSYWLTGAHAPHRATVRDHAAYVLHAMRTGMVVSTFFRAAGMALEYIPIDVTLVSFSVTHSSRLSSWNQQD